MFSGLRVYYTGRSGHSFTEEVSMDYKCDDITTLVCFWELSVSLLSLWMMQLCGRSHAKLNKIDRMLQREELSDSEKGGGYVLRRAFDTQWRGIVLVVVARFPYSVDWVSFSRRRWLPCVTTGDHFFHATAKNKTRSLPMKSPSSSGIVSFASLQ